MTYRLKRTGVSVQRKMELALRHPCHICGRPAIGKDRYGQKYCAEHRPLRVNGVEL